MNSHGVLRFTPRVETLEARWLPSDYRLTPVVPNIDPEEALFLSQVIQRGAQLGNHLNVFARTGDSITVSSQFLIPLATPSAKTDFAGDGTLADTLNYFRSGTIGAQNSFSRITTAAFGGWSSAEVLARMPGELTVTKPAFVLIMVGTNDISAGTPVEVFRERLTAIAQTAINMGVVPVLSTIPNMVLAASLDAQQPTFNQAIEDVGESLNVPVWNYWRAMQKLPNLGISADGIHPSVAPDGGGDLTATGLQYGYNVRNFTAMQTLDKLKRILIQGEPADLPDDAASWAPLTHAIPVATGDPIGFQVSVVDTQARHTLFSFDPFPGFTGGVQVATGDVNGDGRDDIIVGPQANGPAHIRAFTADGQLLVSFYAFAPSFVSGAKVASADVNHDGCAEIVVAAGRGGQGHVIVFDGLTLSVLSSFLAFGPSYAGDVSLVAGDLNGDGVAELAVGMGPGASPTVAVFDPLTGSGYSFLAYASGYQGGVKLAIVNDAKGHRGLVTISRGPAADIRLFDGVTAGLLDGFILYTAGNQHV